MVQSITDKLKNQLITKPKNKTNRNKGSQRNSMNRIPAAITSVMQSSLSFAQSRRKYPGSLRIVGREMLGPLAAGGGVSSETLLQAPVSPSAFSNTRLSQFANLYERYLFTRLDFHYVPNVGTDTDGSILMAYDRDIKDSLSTTPLTKLRQASSMQNAQQVPIYRPTNMKTILSYPEDGFYTGGNSADADARFSFQGQLFILNNSGFTGSSGVLWIDYDIDFFIPVFDRDDLLDSSLQISNVVPLSSALNTFNPNTSFFRDYLDESKYSREIVQKGSDFSLMQAPWNPFKQVIKIAQDSATVLMDWAFQFLVLQSTSATWPVVNTTAIPILTDNLGNDLTNALITAGSLIFGGSPNPTYPTDNVMPVGDTLDWWTTLGKWFLKTVAQDLYLDVVNNFPSLTSPATYSFSTDDYMDVLPHPFSVTINAIDEQEDLFNQKAIARTVDIYVKYTNYVNSLKLDVGSDVNQNPTPTKAPSNPKRPIRSDKNPSTENISVLSPLSRKRDDELD